MSSHSIPAACEEAVENLYALLDEELNEDVRERVQYHFDNCPNCLPLYRFERSYSHFLKARSGALGAPPDLRRRVFENLLLDNGGSDG